MKTALNTKGFNLHMIELNTWVFDDHSGVLFDGKFRNVVEHMVDHGFPLHEVELAMNEILKNNHDSANFGMYKSFIFSYNRKQKVA